MHELVQAQTEAPRPPCGSRTPTRAPTTTLVALDFLCTTCGRTDLPEAGDWDPPICLECDAAINEDAIREEVEHDGDADDNG